MAGSAGPLLMVGLWPFMTLAASYHRRSLPPPSAAFLGGSAKFRL